jgi:hypothetical protein
MCVQVRFCTHQTDLWWKGVDQAALGFLPTRRLTFNWCLGWVSSCTTHTHKHCRWHMYDTYVLLPFLCCWLCWSFAFTGRCLWLLAVLTSVLWHTNTWLLCLRKHPLSYAVQGEHAITRSWKESGQCFDSILGEEANNRTQYLDKWPMFGPNTCRGRQYLDTIIGNKVNIWTQYSETRSIFGPNICRRGQYMPNILRAGQYLKKFVGTIKRHKPNIRYNIYRI